MTDPITIPPPTITTTSHSVVLTSVGLIRETNEDRAAVDGPVLALSDGMGGHPHGELAAEAAVTTAVKYLRAVGSSHKPPAPDVALEEAVRLANHAYPVWTPNFAGDRRATIAPERRVGFRAESAR